METQERWVACYRRDDPPADHWAEGTGAVRHELKTQDRIFRMAEQMRRRRQWTDASPLFALLRAVDEVVEAQAGRHSRVRPMAAAAAAGVTAYRMLFARKPAVSARGWPLGFELVEEGEARAAVSDARARGLDPIAIDALDPAAYTWALFEIDERQTAKAEAERSRRQPVAEPCCLALIGAVVAPLPARVPIPIRSRRAPAPAGAGFAG
jgi:hypothetical protein